MSRDYTVIIRHHDGRVEEHTLPIGQQINLRLGLEGLDEKNLQVESLRAKQTIEIEYVVGDDSLAALWLELDGLFDEWLDEYEDPDPDLVSEALDEMLGPIQPGESQWIWSRWFSLGRLLGAHE